MDEYTPGTLRDYPELWLLMGFEWSHLLNAVANHAGAWEADKARIEALVRKCHGFRAEIAAYRIALVTIQAGVPDAQQRARDGLRDGARALFWAQEAEDE